MNEDPKLETLASVLAGLENYPHYYALFIGGRRPFKSDSPCAILDPHETDDPDDDPPFAVKHRLKSHLSVHTVRQILMNARAQRSNLTTDDAVRAINYYYRNDAFIDFGELIS